MLSSKTLEAWSQSTVQASLIFVIFRSSMAGSSYEREDGGGGRPLDWAAQSNNGVVDRFLKSQGVDKDDVDK